jgi:hypothetical protein
VAGGTGVDGVSICAAGFGGGCLSSSLHAASGVTSANAKIATSRLLTICSPFLGCCGDILPYPRKVVPVGARVEAHVMVSGVVSERR